MRRSQMLPPSFSRQSGMYCSNWFRWKFQECIEKNDLIIGVERQERAQHIGFRPHPAFIQPRGGILEWIKDIVEMHVDATAESRQNLSKDEVHVAPKLRHMRRIDEQDIVLIQLSEPRDIHILQR
jgi:hypothetical protein